MARIAGINIPPQKHAEIGLTAIFGIGRTRARIICEACEIAFSKKVKDLTDGDLEKIRDQIALFTIEGDLRRETTMNIKTSAAIAVSAIVVVCPCVVSVRAPMRVLARVRARPLSP